MLAPFLIPLVAKQSNTKILTFAKPNQLATIILQCFLLRGDAARHCNNSNQGCTQQYTVTKQAIGMLHKCRYKSTQNQFPKPVARSSLTLVKSH